MSCAEPEGSQVPWLDNKCVKNENRGAHQFMQGGNRSVKQSGKWDEGKMEGKREDFSEEGLSDCATLFHKERHLEADAT